MSRKGEGKRGKEIERERDKGCGRIIIITVENDK